MKIYFKTFGCKVNQYETEMLRSQLEKHAFQSVDNPLDAHWCIINTCTVTGESDTKCRHMVKKILRENSMCHVVLTGCYAERAEDELTKISPRVHIIGQSHKGTIPSFITRKKGNDIHSLNTFYHHTRAFVKIQDGCDAFCSYCIVPYVRSRVYSRDVSEILGEVHALIHNGYKEIVLTGIRLGRFSNHSTSLVELVRQIVSIESDFRVRLSSLEIREIDEPLIALMRESSKLCRHLHVPLQSGDDEILRRMNRPYTAEEFSEKIQWIKKQVPDIGITTDVLVGYPGETELQFENTFNLINILEFSRLHVFRFSPRPGTQAAKEPQPLSHREITMRMSIMKVINALLKNRFADRFIETECRVLPEIKKNGRIEGFTDNYIQVKFPGTVQQGNFIIGNLKFLEGMGYTIKI